MKTIKFIIGLFITSIILYSCTHIGEKTKANVDIIDSESSQNQDGIKTMADAAVKMFTWNIQKSEFGAMMSIDVPFQRDTQETFEYLTLTVVKEKSQKRPAFISIIIPNNIVQTNGIFIKFANTIETQNGEVEMEFEKGNPVRVYFEKCDDKVCTAKIVDGYVADEETNEKTDIFQKFMDFDHVLFLFIYPDGGHKSVSIPLFSFKQQYKSI